MANGFNNISMLIRSFIPFFLLINTFCSAQTKAEDCSRFKTGTFQYRDDSSGVIQIKRTATRQVETELSTNTVTKFRIKWTGDCEYEIKKIWTNRKSKPKNYGGVTKIVITKAYEKQYDYSCECKFLETGKSFSGTVVKIE